MSMWLARPVIADGTVDETSTTYIGICDDDGCRHMVDHRDEQIVADALDGHRERAHPENTSGPGPWLTFTSSAAGPHLGTVKANPHMPSPVPREEAP